MLLLAWHIAGAVQIFESNLEASDLSAVFWISDDEVLFLGLTDEYVTQIDGFRKRVSRITTWNLRTKETKRYGTADVHLCYDSGNIAYWERNPAERKDWISKGRFPGEIVRTEGAVRVDPFTCLPDEALPPLPAWTKDRSIVRLRPEHGFLDLGPEREQRNSPIRLVRSGSDKPLELPIRRREFLQAAIRYYAHKGAYFSPGDFFRLDPRNSNGGYNVSPWPEGIARPARWLYPNGSVEEFVIPYAKWIRDDLVPTKVGIVALDSTFFTVTGEAPWDGAYLTRDGKLWSQRFSRGLFGEHSLSEDGCRLAVQRQPEPGKRRPEYWTISVFDVCAPA